MSILIKGMEMPKNCDSCMFSRRSIHNIDWCVLTEKDLPCDCPIVPVPPHGRLIDADALYRKMFVGPDGQIFPNNDVDNWPHTMAFKDIKHHILFAPTIIPAEEGK